MKQLTNKKVLTIAAIILVLVTAIGLAGAFFSDYESAVGKGTVDIGGNTVINEDVQGTHKTITVHNNGDGEVFVRLSVYGPEAEGMTVTPGDGWSKDEEDGFWYYQDVLPAGADTSQIEADIENVPVTVDLSELDIIVVHQSVPVVYDTEGNADMAASWAAATQ